MAWLQEVDGKATGPYTQPVRFSLNLHNPNQEGWLLATITKRPPRRYPTQMSCEDMEAQYLAVIRSELRQGRMLPNSARLIALGYPELPAEIRGHGGQQQVLQRLGYWNNPDRAYEIIQHLCRRGYLPPPDALEAAGFGNIVRVIHAQYGMVEFAHRYGLRAWKSEELPRRKLHRQRAVGRFIAAFARRHRRLPQLAEMGHEGEVIARHTNGLTFLLRLYVTTARHVTERDWLLTLRGPRPRSSYGVWTEKKLARALWPYVVRWIRSGGQIPITTMIHEDQRWDLRHLVSRFGGLEYLLARPCFPQKTMRLLWLSYVEGELLRLAPDEFRQGILPPRTFFLRHAPVLEHIIHKRLGGYRTVAAALGMYTRRDALQVAVRRTTLVALLNHADKRGTFPMETELPWRDRRIIRKARGIPLFLRECSGIQELRLLLEYSANRFQAKCRSDEVPVPHREKLLDTSFVLKTLVKDARQHKRSFRFR